MAIARHRLPPEDDLQPVVHDEVRKPAADARPAVAGQAHSLAPSDSSRDAYFRGSYGATPAAQSPADMPLHQLLAKFQLPESLEACVSRLIAIARQHGMAEAIVAAGKDPSLDGNHREHARQLLAFACQGDHKPRL